MRVDLVALDGKERTPYWWIIDIPAWLGLEEQFTIAINCTITIIESDIRHEKSGIWFIKQYTQDPED